MAAPEELIEDSKWLGEHLGEIAKKHPNEWVAVVDRKVVAHGKIIAEAQRSAMVRTGRQEFPIDLARAELECVENKAGIRHSD